MEGYIVTYLPLDDLIPFCEWFLIPYYLWYPYLLGIGLFLLFFDSDGFKKYMTFIGIGFIGATVIFLLFPNGQDLRVTEFANDNIFTRAIAGLYIADTNTNVCPSLHVVGSLAGVIAVFHSKKMRNMWLRIAVCVLAALICAATVFIKQHSVVDFLVSLPYCAIIYTIVYMRKK